MDVSRFPTSFPTLSERETHRFLETKTAKQQKYERPVQRRKIRMRKKQHTGWILSTDKPVTPVAFNQSIKSLYGFNGRSQWKSVPTRQRNGCAPAGRTWTRNFDRLRTRPTSDAIKRDDVTTGRPRNIIVCIQSAFTASSKSCLLIIDEAHGSAMALMLALERPFVSGATSRRGATDEDETRQHTVFSGFSSGDGGAWVARLIGW